FVVWVLDQLKNQMGGRRRSWSSVVWQTTPGDIEQEFPLLEAEEGASRGLPRVGRGRYQLVVAADGYAVRKRASASDLLTSLARSSPAPPSVKARVPPSRSLRRTSGRGRETFRPL